MPKKGFILVVVLGLATFLLIVFFGFTDVRAQCPSADIYGDWKIYKAQRRDGVTFFVMWPTQSDAYIRWPACQLPNDYLQIIPAEKAKETAWCHDPANQNDDPSDDCRDSDGNPVGPPDNAPRFALCYRDGVGKDGKCFVDLARPGDPPNVVELTGWMFSDGTGFADATPNSGNDFVLKPGAYRPVMIKKPGSPLGP